MAGIAAGSYGVFGAARTAVAINEAIKELRGTSVLLSRSNLPYRIVRADRDDTMPGGALIVNNAKYMCEDEVGRLREFVSGGGTLIATGLTSLCNIEGETRGDFGLADVFGVSYSGRKSMRISYLLDAEHGHILADDPAPLVRATTAQSLSKVAEPYFDPDGVEHYSSIHSNPPGPASEFDGLTVNSYGKGTCAYLYSSLLGIQQDAQQTFGLGLLRQYIRSVLVQACNAPVCVEVTILRSMTSNGYLLCFVIIRKSCRACLCTI